ncbi:uncharacterized protein LOC125944497 [Dermacentor silvarum]|uniref:uncharacterized protein LOC125944497 n=1 Tax=Dermacentor silvarum TaxID=543639 RepID=UPI0021011EB2|nr:uncharacterized protein LOC125944497 [Dermacentor silvarum]
MPYVLPPSMGVRSTAVGTAAMPMGMGSMGIGSMGMNTMGQQLGGVMIPTGGNVAQNPPPVVLTDGSGQNKVVGSANPLTGVIAVDADKLKEGLGAATAEDPPAPPPAE